MIINNSRVSTYLECARKFYWRYIYKGGIERTAIHPALAFGTMMHHLLALYYSDQDWRDGLTDALYAGVPGYDTFPDLEKTKWQENLSWAERMMTEYVKWAGKVDNFSVLEVESEGIVPLGRICYVCGREYPKAMEGATAGELPPACAKCHAEIHYLVYKTDLIVNSGGSVFPIDHKTTSGIGDSYLASWHYSPQMYLYLKGTQEVHPTANRFQMNFLRKAKQVGQWRTKQCPDCRGGAKKKMECTTCGYMVRQDFNKDFVLDKGKIAVQAVDPPPFHRSEPIIMQPEVMDRVELSRLQACNDILLEGATPIEVDPLVKWRMEPDKCFDRGRCPYIDLCWSKRPVDKWHTPTEDLLDGYVPRPKDYVTLAREEQI